VTDSTPDDDKGVAESVTVTEEETGDSTRAPLPDTEATPAATQEQGQEKATDPTADSKAAGKDTEEPASGDSAELEPDAGARRGKSPQMRINTLTRRLRESETEAAYLRGRLEALEGKGKPEPTGGTEAETDDGRPKIDDFDTAEEFADALADWKLEHRERQPAGKEPNGSQASTPRDVGAARQPTPAEVESYKAAAAKYEDLEEVLFDPELPWTKHMADAVSEEQDAAEMLYLLGKNPAELERISRLSPKAQEREVWRFVDRTRAERAAAGNTPGGNPAGRADGSADATPRAKAQPGSQVSRAAPVPGTSLSGSSAAVSRRLEDMTDEEYVEEMNRREAARMRRA
jgi:hypothetical protein